ncbi:zinc finger protein BALDIBIS [Trifolium repens]|nr:zinc finger protein BALDIBIS [Trifolium repens]
MMSKQPFSSSSHSNIMKASSSNHVQQSNTNPNPNLPKKKRNLPGTPDPDSEVVAMSPKSLMATNRFLCEICNKGFQRDQNLQLHQRGHNLPWKLKQRSNKDQVKKKVYVCPEKSCVHHEPSRALGDLTGIKKHYSRKHGEKKWKCEKCSKKYAVQSDWKAHSKICGTREYKCDCGTIFSRKDSFITHRAFCDALTEESGKITTVPAALSNFRNDHMTNTHQSPRIPQIFPGFQFHSEFINSATSSSLWQQNQANNSQLLHQNSDIMQTMDVFGSQTQIQWLNNYNGINLSLPMLHGVMKQEQEQEENKDLSHSVISSLYLSQNQQGGSNHMSATSLLQKASQIGSTRTIISNDNNTVFNNVNHSFNNIVHDVHQKFYNKQDENVELNELVNVGAGEYLFNDSNSNNLFGIVNGTKDLDHVVMSVDKETSTRHIHRLKEKNQMGLTRDFLGVGDDDNDDGSMSRTFLQHELGEFNGMGTLGNNLQIQYGGGHYC